MKHCVYSVFRDNFGDCTNNGLSSKVDKAIMFFECTAKEAVEYCENNGIDPRNQFILEQRTLWGKDYSYAIPLLDGTPGCFMFGGNFLYTSNSNSFHYSGEHTTRPIPIHDRVEKTYY